MKLFKLELTPPVRALSALALMLGALTARADYPVPQDCKRVEYIYSSNKAWVDLGIHPQAGQIVDIALMHTGAANSYFFGCETVGLGYFGGGFRTRGEYSGKVTLNTPYHVHIYVAPPENANGYYYIDEFDKNYPYGAQGAKASDTQTYYLFTYDTESVHPASGQNFSFRLISLKISNANAEGDGHTCIMNLLPVKQGNVARLFDTVTGAFFDNGAGVGSLTAGPELGQTMEIAGEPFAPGAVTPAYGTTEKILCGTTTACTAPASAEYLDGTATCTGYILYEKDNDGVWQVVRDENATTAEVTQGENPLRLVWQWQANAAPSVAAPVVTSHPFNAVSLSCAVASAGTGGSSSELSIVYGTSAGALNSSQVVGTCSNGGTYTATISGLAANKEYFFKAVLKQGGVVVAESDVVSATTNGRHYAVPLTVDGYSGTAIADFAVPVRISEDRINGFSYADVPDVSHIAFAADDNDEIETPYPFEVECWNPGGESIVWVKIPSLAKDAKFFFHWGDKVVAPAGNDPTAVWTSDFVGVWHMNEPDSTVANSTSLGQALDAEPTGTLTCNNAFEGVVASGRRVGFGTQTSYLRVAKTPLLSVGPALTFSTWIKMTMCPGVERIVQHTSGENNLDGWGMATVSGAANSIAVMGSQKGFAATKATVPDMRGVWTHLSFVFNNETAEVYANGVLKATIAISAIIDKDTNVLDIGNSLRGGFDECRFRSRAVSADEVTAEYASMNNANFLTVGDVIAPGRAFVTVDAVPAQLGEPSGGYGLNGIEGDQVHLEMLTPSVEIEEGVSRRNCTGWTFVGKSGATITGLGTVAEFAYTETGTLTWQFTNLQYRATAAVSGEGAVSVNGGTAASAQDLYLNAGEDVAFTVVPEPGKVFYGWTLDGRVVGREKTLVLPMEAQIDGLTAHVGGAEYPIPSDCVRVEYIKSNGSQWIDLHVKPAAGHIIDFRISFDSLANGYYFGCDTVMLGGWGSGSLFRFPSSTATAADLGVIYNLRIEVATADWPTGAYFVENIDEKYPTSTGGAIAATDNQTYFLFGRTSAAKWPDVAEKGSYKVYAFRITQDDVIPVLNLVPVRKGTTAMLFDTVSGKLFSTAEDGAGTLTKGPDLVSSLEIAGEPMAAGEVTPAYGTTPSVTWGTVTDCTAPASSDYLGGTAACTGYVLYEKGDDGAWTEVRRGPETTVSVKQEEKPLRLAWQWQANAAPAVEAPVVTKALCNALSLSAFVGSAGTDGAESELSIAYGLAANALTETLVLGTCANPGTYAGTITGLAANKTYYLKSVLKQGGEVVAESSVVSVRAGARHYAVSLTAANYAGEAVSDFVLPVRISEERIAGFRYSDVADRTHIAFAADDDEEIATPYPFEVESWNPGGESIVWVKIPSLAKDAKLFFHWGDAVSVANDPTAVWTDYAGVWHMNEATGNVANATPAGSALDAEPKGSVPSHTSFAGPVGLGRQIGVQNAKGYLQVPGSSALSLGNKLTMSGWVTLTSASGNMYLFRHKGGDANANGWGLALAGGNWASLSVMGSSSAVGSATIPTTRLKWVYLTVVFDGTSASVYANGEFVKTVTVASVVDLDTNPLAFGAVPNSSGTVCGAYDECRLSAGAMDAGRIAADYAAMNDKDFLTAGDISTPGLKFVMVDAAPVQMGEPDGGYGANFVEGDMVRLEMLSGAVTNAAEGTLRNCTGWTFVPKSGNPITGLGTTAEFPYAGTGTLTWQFTNLQYRVTVDAGPHAPASVNGGAAATPCADWVTAGEPVDIALAPEPGYRFIRWTGDLASNDPESPALEYAAIDAPIAVRATVVVPADHYVKEGLVFLLDGIENTSALHHDPAATVWRDLSGNGFDFTLSSNGGSWTSAGYLYSAGNWVGPCAKNAAALDHKIVTCEFVWSTETPRNDLIFCPGKLGGYNRGMSLFTTAAGEVGVLSGGGTDPLRYATQVETGATNRFTVTYSFASATEAIANNIIDFLVNGEPAHLTYPGYVPASFSQPTLGGVKSGNSSARGTLMALRIYDRVLTPEELAHNASVDNDRFFGVFDGGFSPTRTFVRSEPGVFGSPAPECGEHAFALGSEQTFALTARTYAEDGVTAYPSVTNSGIRAAFDGAVVAEDGGEPVAIAADAFTRTITAGDTDVTWNFKDVQYRLIVRSSGGGTVKVNDGEWGACVTNWLAPGASVTVSASDDLALAGWGGDLDGTETAGNAISFTMTAPRMLVAQRPQAFAATIDDYVTRGLELWLDAIANDGVENAHRTDIRYWKDISGHGYDLVNLAGDVAWPWTENALSPTVHDSKFKPQVENFAFDWSKATVDWTSYIVPVKGVNTGSFFAHGSTGNYPYAMIDGNGHLSMRTGSGAAISIYNNNYVAGAHALLADGMQITVFQEATGYSSASVASYAGSYEIADSFFVAASSGNSSQTLAPFHGLRLYSRVLNDYELRWNALVDRYRFLGESPDLRTCQIDVMAQPKSVGAPVPGYGVSSAAFGYNQEFSVAGTLATDPFDGARVVSAAPGERYVYEGYRICRGNTVTEGTSETFALDVELPIVGVEWQFAHEYRVLATANEGNTVEIADGPSGASVTNWYAAGETVTLRAVAKAGSAFLGWRGDIAGIPDVSATEITLPMDRAYALQAIFLADDHDPVTITWGGAASGNWYDPACWDLGSVPQKGDTVVINPSDAVAVTIDMPTPVLGKVVIGNTGTALATTLTMLNWQTCLEADEIVITNGGVVTTQGGFATGAMSNRVWLAGRALTIAEGGKINVKACGSSTSNGGSARLDFTGLVRIDGDIDANGVRSYANYATGSGGDVRIACAAVTGSGRVLARPIDYAMANTQSFNGGGNGGGIAVDFDPAAQAAVTDCLVRFDASGSVKVDANAILGSWMDKGIRSQATVYDEDNTSLAKIGTLWMTDATLLKAASYRTSGWRFGGRWASSEPIGALVFDEPILLDQCNLYLDGSVTEFTARQGVTVTGTGRYSRRDSGLVLSNTVVTVEGDLAASGSRFEIIGGSLTVNGDVILTDSGYAATTARRYSGGEVAIGAMATNGTANAYGAVFTVNGSVNVSFNSVVYLKCHPTDGAIPYMSAENVTVAQGGKISAENGGWGRDKGPGTTVSDNYGASYGGRGSPVGGAKPTYGSAKRPVRPGSGGRTVGGGVVRLDVERTLTLDGEIMADASKWLAGVGSGRTSGSGGSVYVRARTLAGGGRFSAAGGLANENNAAGGGGRIAIWTNHTDEWTGTATAEGGYKSETSLVPLTEKLGEDGTVFWHAYPGGTLILVR